MERDIRRITDMSLNTGDDVYKWELGLTEGCAGIGLDKILQEREIAILKTEKIIFKA